jgi:putative hydrolase of the HAD superfamily
VTLRAVLFDVGNTLLSLEYPRLAREVGARLGLPLDAGTLEAASLEAREYLERGDTDRERASAYLLRSFRLAGVPDSRLAEVGDVLLELHRERHLWSHLAPDTLGALGRLAAAGLRLGAVSNSEGRAEASLIAAGLRPWFEVVIDSARVGVEKPDPRIFRLALDQMGIGPAETVYVGDIYAVDVVGARAAGITPLLLDPGGRHRDRDLMTAATVAQAATMLLERARGG